MKERKEKYWCRFKYFSDENEMHRSINVDYR